MNFIDALTIDGTAKRPSDGALIVDARAARTGIQIYHGSELGKPEMAQVRVYRPGSEVFAPDSMRSFAHRPITNDHPKEPVTSDNWKQHAVGNTTDEVRAEGIFIRVPLMVSDKTAISAIESGKSELSAGYSCDLDFTPGLTPSGMAYDAIQKNIRINHIAIVDHGRAGSECRIGDSWGSSPLETINDRNKDPKTMAKIITLDGFPIDIGDANVAETVINRLNATITDLKGSAAKLVTDHGAVIADKDKKIGELTAQLDAATKKIPDAAALDAMVADRVDVITKARTVDAAIAITGTNADIRRRLVSTKLGDAAVKDVSDDTVAGMFAVLTKDVKPSNTDPLQAVFDTNRGTPPNTVADRGQSAYEKRIEDGWKSAPGAA